MAQQQIEVLVAGAGPVGLITALVLTEAGVQTQIIDRETRTTTGSYACALHPPVLRLLDRLGVATRVLEQGRKIRKVAFYDGDKRRAELDLGELGGDFPFLLILPQGDFEEALEQRLLEKGGVAVQWNHRFDDFQVGQEDLEVTLEKLGGTSTGYIVPHWEKVVQKRFTEHVRFLVGADGYNSIVRQRLGFEFRQLRGPDFFAAYEFESDSVVEDEVRVVLDESTTNVLWPLPGRKCRWTFQLVKSATPQEFPEKERHAIRLEQGNLDEEVRAYVQQVSSQRAPWFTKGVKEVTWCTDVVFEHRLASSFGKNRCWLVGDAAHQTGPVGAQSMNVGMLEAEALAQRLAGTLRGKPLAGGLDQFNAERRKEWSALLGVNGTGFQPQADIDDWVKRRLPRLLDCIPASGDDLRRLARQLKADFIG